MDKHEIVALLNKVVTPVYQIEVNLGMPKTTLQKAISGERKLPKKWAIKLLETYPPPTRDVQVVYPKGDKKENEHKQAKKAIEEGLVKDIPFVATKHGLWKNGDPKENTAAFYMKYDCYTYKELENR